MKKLACCLMFIAVLGSTACSIRTSAIHLAGAERRAPTDPGAMLVYMSEKDVAGEFKKIALVYAEEGFYFGSPSVGRLIERMKEKAAAIGANGLILGGVEKELSVSGGGTEPASLSEKKLMKAVAIFIER
jgi:hypothetical protein